jgi:hypothetical protein
VDASFVRFENTGQRDLDRSSLPSSQAAMEAKVSINQGEPPC